MKNTYFMQTNNEYLDEWPVRPYSKRELAMAYAPDISPCSALNRWMRRVTKTGSGFSPPCKWN